MRVSSELVTRERRRCRKRLHQHQNQMLSRSSRGERDEASSLSPAGGPAILSGNDKPARIPGRKRTALMSEFHLPLHSVDVIPKPALDGITIDFRDTTGTDLLGRWDRVHDWFGSRLRFGLDPYGKRTRARIAPECTATLRDGSGAVTGVNFASQDYLNLASHPSICTAAIEAINQYGVHSAGSAALMGDTLLADLLERRIASFLNMEDCTLLPTGWAAGYGAVRTLAGAGDHIIIDVLAHACLQEGARCSGAQVHSFPHLSIDAVRRRLTPIRAEAPQAGILVVTEGLYSMDSDTPDLRVLQALCSEFAATLLVDVAHDLGSLGPGGRGALGMQEMIGKVDVVMGSFSKTFASNGGFVASRTSSLKTGLRYFCNPLTFSNALSPVQAAIVLAAFDIVDSPEGDRRRADLLANAIRLREGLADQGFQLLGAPSAIVPVILGTNGYSRLMTREAMRLGALVNLVEYPAVSRNGCRWRLQVMADHSKEQIARMLEIASSARSAAEQYI